MAVESLQSHLETQYNFYTPFALPVDAVSPLALRRIAAVYDVTEGK